MDQSITDDPRDKIFFSRKVCNPIFLMIIIQTYSIYQPLCHHGEWVVSDCHVISKLLVVGFTTHGVLVYAIRREMITHILTWHHPWNRDRQHKNSKKHSYLPLHNCKLFSNKRSKIKFCFNMHSLQTTEVDVLDSTIWWRVVSVFHITEHEMLHPKRPSISF